MGEEVIGPSDVTVKVLQDIADATGKDYEELLKMYMDARAFLDKPQHTEQLKDERARANVRSSLRSEMSSPAPVLYGMMLAKSEAFNTNERYYKAALEQFNSDEKMKYIDNGVITDDGMPIDRRPTYSTGRANPNFGKIFPRFNWMRNCVGALSIGEGEPRPSKVTLSRQVALQDVPLYVPVQVRLNNRTDEKVKDEYILNGASVTKFRPIDNPDIPSPEVIIENYFAKYYSTIIDLETTHSKFILNPGRAPGARARLNPTRLTLLDAYLVYLDETKNETTGNYRMVVEDDSIGFAEEDEGRRGTVIWLAEFLYEYIKDAGKGTRMFILGQTTQPQTSIDFTTGERTNTPGDVGINASGLVVKEGWFLEKEDDVAGDVVE